MKEMNMIELESVFILSIGTEEYDIKTAITMAIAKMKECNLDNDKLLRLYGGVYFFINKLTSAESCVERYLDIRTNKGSCHE
jgi:hypothetical protein